MAYLSDIEIAQQAEMEPIAEVAKRLDIDADDLELYGKYKAKVSFDLWEKVKDNEDGKLILVTAITPTPAGEGKTTTSVGLAQALAKLGKKVTLALREPSLGPVFGVKGGAAGGGYSQVVPGRPDGRHQHPLHRRLPRHHLGAQPSRRDARQLRPAGQPAEHRPAPHSLQARPRHERPRAPQHSHRPRRQGRRCAAPGRARDLEAQGAMAMLLKDAIKPNLVQTLEHVPAFIHGGPFANIAHGCNSVMATKYGLKLADYFVTEAGFAADLGAEKFLDIKCRLAGLKPNAVVIVATIRALKMHGGVAKEDLGKVNMAALEAGIPNLEKHVENMLSFGLPVVVALNAFPTDTEEELKFIQDKCAKLGVPVVESDIWAKGGEGGIAMAEEVIKACDKPNTFHYLYDEKLSPKEKIETIATKIYGADGVVYTDKAEKDLKKIYDLGKDDLLICMAKTQASISDDPNKKGRPTGFKLTVREVRLSAGAGFIIPITGSIMTMPGLPKRPAACNIDVDASGKVSGLF